MSNLPLPKSTLPPKITRVSVGLSPNLRDTSINVITIFIVTLATAMTNKTRTIMLRLKENKVNILAMNLLGQKTMT